MKRIFSIFLLLLATKLIYAQQDPQYTQYMYNMNVLNPAYAGSFEGISIGALYRSQWVGLDGAPSTGTFNVHLPIEKNVGIGFSIIKDEIGPVRETNAYVDFSYTLKLGQEHKFALGIKAGTTFHNIGIWEGQIDIIDAGDPFFAENINEVSPNIGIGAYFYLPNKYYVSVSIPNMLNSIHLDAAGNKIGSETQHFFTAAGYVFNISENFKLKPHVMVKLAFDAPLSFDINTNVFMYDLVEIGFGYRLDDSFSGMINFILTPRLRIGYSYDNIRSNLNIVTNSSHEVFINFDIVLPKRVSRSPRYF